MILSVEIGSYFSSLAEKLGPHDSIENLLANHTIYKGNIYYDVLDILINYNGSELVMVLID